MRDGVESLHLNVIVFFYSVIDISSLIATCDPLDIEEITHKAGNFKKFSVFVRMLSSAFSKESESVFIDLLTYNDLEMLKARKTASSSSSSSISSSSTVSSTAGRSQLKRYVILTYQGEFDRVHYPLPLAFEEIPNSEALRKTILRLRARLDGTQENDIGLGDYTAGIR